MQQLCTGMKIYHMLEFFREHTVSVLLLSKRSISLSGCRFYRNDQSVLCGMCFLSLNTIELSIATSSGTPESSQTTRIIEIARRLAWKAYLLAIDHSNCRFRLIFPLFPFIHRRVSQVQLKLSTQLASFHFSSFPPPIMIKLFLRVIL